MWWCNPQTVVIRQCPYRRGLKHIPLFCQIAQQTIGHLSHMLAAEYTYQRVDLGPVFEHLLALPFRQATGHNHPPGTPAVFQRQHLVDGLVGFLAGLFNESTGIDDNKVSSCGFVYQLVTVQLQQTQHPFAVDQVFRAAETDKGIRAFGLTTFRRIGSVHVLPSQNAQQSRFDCRQDSTLMIAHPTDRNEAAQSAPADLAAFQLPGAMQNRSRLTNAQFSVRTWLIFSGGCAAGCSLLGLRLHAYLTTCGSMLLLFWAGVAVAFVGEVLNEQRDCWLLPAVCSSIVGSLVALISLFTAMYYGALFLVSHVARSLSI